MAENVHDAVVNYIAKTRFPFPGQKTWAPDYRTLTNVPARKHGIQISGGEHFPDIVILDGTGRVREIGEVEMNVSNIAPSTLKATSETADADTPTRFGTSSSMSPSARRRRHRRCSKRME